MIRRIKLILSGLHPIKIRDLHFQLMNILPQLLQLFIVIGIRFTNLMKGRSHAFGLNTTLFHPNELFNIIDRRFGLRYYTAIGNVRTGRLDGLV